MNGRKKAYISGAIIGGAFLMALLTNAGCDVKGNINKFLHPDTSTNTSITTSTSTSAPISAPENDEKNMTVHFLDVGQGDSIFIELPNNETMLIDASEAEYADKISTYVYSQGYEYIDYVIATHNHADHIGGMGEVLDTLKIGTVYSSPTNHTSKTYADMIGAIYRNNIQHVQPTTGYEIINTIIDGKTLKCIIVSPSEPVEDLNNSSLVLKLTYGESDFVFTGDIEKEAEDLIRANIKCDVLKIAHHGSSTSTSDNFLKKTEPTYAVISCGLNNSYEHPHDVIINRLLKRNIQIFRTDHQGDIIFTTIGYDDSMTVNKSAYGGEQNG